MSEMEWVQDLLMVMIGGLNGGMTLQWSVCGQSKQHRLNMPKKSHRIILTAAA